jgi:enoyl ACP reductase
VIEGAQLGGRKMLECRNDLGLGNRRLNVRRNTAPWRDEWLKLLPHSHQRIRHGDDDLALEGGGKFGDGGCSRVPWSGEHDDVASCGLRIVATGELQVSIRPFRLQGLHYFATTLGGSRSDEPRIPHRGKTHGKGRTCGPGAAEVADARKRSSHVHYRSDVAILAGKRLVITGVLTDASLAFGVAKLAQEQGASVMLTGAGRGLSITERTARKLPNAAPVAEFDATNPDHVASVRAAAEQHLGGVDGVLHSIGFAPAACLGDDLMAATWDDVSVAVQVSAFSLKTLADAFIPLMNNGGSIVGLDFDNTVAWPAYNWMGVAKSALESTSRYLARELGPRGIRCNLVAAGPIRTMAAKSIPSFAQFEDIWSQRAPLGWDIHDSSAVARACCALLSDWFPATTGEIVHVDGGYHAVGA